MFDSGEPGGPGRALRLVAAGIDALAEVDPGALSDAEIVALVKDIEVAARRLPATSHRLVAEISARDLARRAGLRDTAVLLGRELVLAPGEAKARVATAADLAPRTDADGVSTPAPLAATAEAQRRGELSAAQVAVIREVIDSLPPQLRTAHGPGVEARLIEQARTLTPARLAAYGAHLVREVDTDQVARQEAEHQRRRAATFTLHPDGSADLRAHLTPAAAAIVQAVITPLAAPRPDDAAGPDQRTAPQRLHDGLTEACRRALTAQCVPGETGVPVTVLLTIPLADLKTATATATGEGAGQATGRARTQYGQDLTIHQMLKLAGEALVIPVVVDEHQAPLHLGRAKRLASKEQTYALITRDRGCTFPGCDHPPPWTQRHHIQPWIHHGRTDLDNLTLLCPYHHANFETLGWQCLMINGIPHWKPPARIDPTRTPTRNTAHHHPHELAAA